MAESDGNEGRRLDRRTFVAAGAGAAVAAGLAGSIARPDAAAASSAHAAGRSGGRGVVLETVTGPIKGKDVDWALEHEHLFVDFDGAKDPSYQDVDWADVTGACVNSVNELRAQGVNLFVSTRRWESGATCCSVATCLARRACTSSARAGSTGRRSASRRNTRP